jgi:hypothetical protein
MRVTNTEWEMIVHAVDNFAAELAGDEEELFSALAEKLYGQHFNGEVEIKAAHEEVRRSRVDKN